MNREEAKNSFYCLECGSDGVELVNEIFDKVENEILELKKENTRLKKQLANNHHVECSCSFCKPVELKEKETSQRGI